MGWDFTSRRIEATTLFCWVSYKKKYFERKLLLIYLQVEIEKMTHSLIELLESQKLFATQSVLKIAFYQGFPTDDNDWTA